MSNEYLFDRYKYKVTRLCGKKKQCLPVRKHFLMDVCYCVFT